MAEFELDVATLLRTEEHSGRVERKLSLMGSRKATDSRGEERRRIKTILEAAVAMGNSLPGESVYLIFGQRDDGTIAGEVDPDGYSLTPEQAKSARDRLTDLLMQVGIAVSWHSRSENSRRVWIAQFIGRRRGFWYTTADGAILVRSGGRTYPADPNTVAGWVAERLEMTSRSRHDAAIDRLHLLQEVGEAIAAFEDATAAAALDAPLGPPSSWTVMDRVALAPVEKRWLDYWSALRGVDRSLVGLVDTVLPTSRQLVREQRPPLTAKDLLPAATAELRQALELAHADINRINP